MKPNKKIFSGMILLIGIILLLHFSSAYMSSTNVQTSQFSTSKGIEFTQEMCQQGQDFIIQIVPFGCTPAVVRTDLLEESDVWVYCQLGATKINPLIDVESIDSISFSGSYPKEVSGIGFHPARAALGVEEKLNMPILENIGYVVIKLRKQANASAIPDYISGNLTAKISYDVKTVFGIGKALFYIPEFPNDKEWEAKKYKYSFWGGKGYLKADEISSDRAQISIYTDTGKLASVNLKKGETSQNIYLPGFECQAGLKLKLEDLDVADTRAQLRINAEVVEVTEGERFLDNRCEVKKDGIKKQGLVQKIKIYCREDEKSRTFDLTINPKIILEINGKEKEVGLGQWLYGDKTKNVYLGYVGTDKDSKKTEDLFVYLVSMPQKKDNLTEDELASISSLVKDLTSVEQGRKSGIIRETDNWLKYVGGLSSLVGRFIANGQNFHRINFKDKNEKPFGTPVSIIGFAGAQDQEFPNSKIKEAYENSKKDYETIRKSFSSEIFRGETTYGEEALYNEIMLAWDAAQEKTLLELCKEFIENYPNSKKDITVCTDVYKLSSQETEEAYITINNEIKKISFDGIAEPSFDDYGAIIIVNTPSGGGDFYLRKSQTISGEDFSLNLISLEENSARVQISVKTSKGTKTEVVNLIKDVTNYFEEGYSFTLSKINLKRVAKVSLIPNINNIGTQANFSFKIGIEKRAIQLSPEKIKQKIKDLDSSINKWQNISDALGNVTKGLKTACLAAGATLIVKNFIANAGGAGIARQHVMRGANGWYEKCTSMVNAGTYISVDKCLIENADKIDSDVETFSNLIEQQNAQIKKLEEGITTREFLSEKVVNTDEFVKKYTPQVKNCLENLPQDSFADPNGKGEEIEKEQILKILSLDYEGGKYYSIEELRNIELYCMAASKSNLKEIADTRLYFALSDIQTTSKSYVEIKSLEEELTEKGFKNIGIRPFVRNGIVEIYDGGTDSQGRPVQGVIVDNDLYILELKPIANNRYAIERVYDKNNNQVPNAEEIKSKYAYFQKYDAFSYKNKYQNAELRYYETEPYKGLPAIVPFDLENGWYAAIKQTLPVGSNIAAYEASGRVISFYVCNVGQNGMEENIGGDDICEMINTGTGQPYNQFPGITDEVEAKNLIKKAQEAIEQASKISESQRKGYVNILGKKVKVGEPAADIPDFQCQDFMSPKECLLLFNLCDPVICPSSRCDLGGAYPVRNVVQSGVIGSIVLCLPNAREGIIIPVCLTGIKAGIDGFLSIKKSYRDCLQESLDTGKMIGICDEIYSIYICDFFWRQALPFADIVIPKIIEALLGQNVRGGGEYLGVASAWEGADKAINYFVNYYGTDAKNAFLVRTTEGFVDNVCKMYASAVVPSGADLINTLTSPDSPAQFHGRFDEIPLTTATVPPTSHYKVFYHIYAGQDSGAYYQVYLKGTPETSYYHDIPYNYIVASGYIAVGGYASETKDFVATSGYKQLCINVNGQEECGFKEVSTSFAINYIEDEYLKSQATKTNIRTESECISGSASAYNLLNPNVQSAAEEVINPAIYNQGIIRVCATANPGLGTDPYAGTEQSRWVDVGYCGNTKIRCWLDTDSVKDVIKTTTVEGETLDEVSGNYMKILQNQGGYLSEEEFSSKIKEIKAEKEPSKKISLVNEIIDKVFWSGEKVELLYLRGNAYREIFDVLCSKLIEYPSGSEKERFYTPSETTTSETSIRGKIYEAAKQPNGLSDNAAKFVSRSLATAGVQGISIVETVDYLVSKIEEKKEFSEIDVKDLKAGDIVLIGKGCKKNYSIGIVGVIEDNKKKVYTNLKNQVQLEDINFVNTIENDPYIYKAYRYVGDTHETPKIRAKWTLIRAINKVNERRGRYDANKAFVDELIFDGLLTEKECDEIRGTGVFRLQKDMNWLRRLLLEKCAKDSECTKQLKSS